MPRLAIFFCTSPIFYVSCHIRSCHVTFVCRLCVTFPCCLCWNYTSVASILLNSTIQRQFNPKNGSPGRLTCEVFEKNCRTWPEERKKLQKLFNVEDVPSQTVSLREAVRSSSIGLGQGFFKCTCTTGCNNRRCKKPYKICNSRCHNSNSCKNK